MELQGQKSRVQGQSRKGRPDKNHQAFGWDLNRLVPERKDEPEIDKHPWGLKPSFESSQFLTELR